MSLLKNAKNKLLVRISSVVLVAIIIGSTVLSSVVNVKAANVPNTVDGLKKSLYAMAAYNCINWLEPEVAIGNPKYSVLGSYVDQSTTYIGTWLGDNNGSISCKDAFQKFDKTSGNIAKENLNSGSIFDGVYELSTTGEKRFQVKYAIINQDESGYYGNGHQYTWPQGYWTDGEGNLHDSTSATGVWIYFNDDGLTGKIEGLNSSMNPTLGQSLREHVFFNKDPSKMAKSIVMQGEVFAYQGQTIHGDPMTGYATVQWSDDNTPFTNYFYDVKDANKAHVYYKEGTQYDKFVVTVEDVASISQLKLKDGGVDRLKQNIANSYFGGQTPEDYINGNSTMMYILTGRYLFNGDGGFAAGCNGVTVSKTDKDFDSLDQRFWDASLESVEDIQAYKSNASSKTDYLTKFGGNGLNESGATSSHHLLPNGGTLTCDQLASEFNGKTVEATAKAAKNVVWGWIKPVKISELPEDNTNNGGGGGGGTNDDGTSGGNTDEREEKCYSEAKSLGWIICPMIFGLEEVAKNIYDAIEPLIRVDDSVVGQMNSSSGIYNAWSTFRGFANVIFVILFMFVIFSQLTGFGIDNYGIKKMLPKIIITAILVNFSFYICAIAIDISNIVGTGIRQLLESINIGESLVSGNNAINGFKEIVAIVLDTLLVAGTLSGAAIGAFMLNGWAIIIPILLFLLVAVIAIIFAFIVLGVRQAAVILCVVFAPLAFACNMLPNTEKVFKRWLDIFKGVLMVYPIVGGLIGAGYFASKILLTREHDLLMSIVAGLLCVVPYFMIPSLLKKSLAAAGNIGERIAGIGKGAGKGLKGAINNSEGVKLAKESSALDARYMRKNSRPSRWLDNKTMEMEKKYRGKKGARAWIANHTIAGNGRLRAAARNSNARVDNARETVVQSAQAAMARTHRMETGGFEARDANLENQALEGAIADQTSLWEKDGTFGSDSKFKSEVTAAMLGDDDASKAKLEALMRKATNGSDKHRELLRDGVNEAFKTGNVSKDQAARFGSHVTNNSVYKKQNRSMHDQANTIMDAVGNGTYGTTGTRADGSTYDHRVQSLANENFVGAGFTKGKQSAEAAFSYDDGEFNALTKKMQSINQELSSGSITEERKTELTNTKQKIAETLGEGIYIKQNDTTNKYANVDKNTIKQMRSVIEAGYGKDGVSQFIKPSPDSGIRVDHSQPQIVTENVEGEFRRDRSSGNANLPDPGNNQRNQGGNNGNGPIILT